MLKLIASVESVRRQIDEAFLGRAIRAYLSQSLSDADLAKLLEATQLKRYSPGDVLFKEGDRRTASTSCAADR